MKITSPVRGRLTVVQGPHDLYVGGKLVQVQRALDLSPRFPWVIDWTIRAPLKGTVVNFFKETGTSGNSYFELKTEDRYRHFFVHSNKWNKVPVGWKTKQGGKLGWIDATSIFASHLHYFIFDPKGKPVDVVKYYEDRGLPKTSWLRDPNKLLK